MNFPIFTSFSSFLSFILLMSCFRTDLFIFFFWKINCVVRGGVVWINCPCLQSHFVCLIPTVSTATGNGIQTNNSNHTTTRSFSNMFTHNRDALIRSSYVFGGLCLLALVYFGFRSLHLRRRKTSKRTGTRRYLPLSTGGRDVQELVPFDGDDEDEDTLFDTSRPSNPTN